MTSDYHSRRTIWTFRKVLRGLPVEVGIIPASSADLRMLELIREGVKFLYYMVRFGVYGERRRGNNLALGLSY